MYHSRSEQWEPVWDDMDGSWDAFVRAWTVQSNENAKNKKDSFL